ncbi:MAG: hypothetical protein ACOX6Y_10570 [Christensenellales bacterium]|jgi:hypothetical protein
MIAQASFTTDASSQIKQVYIYKLDHDTGVNPNPFGDYCTLAHCKDRMREKIAEDIKKFVNHTLSIADMGIWVIGIAGKRLDFNGSNRYGRIVYAMQVTEVLTFDEYWKDPRFAYKQPNLTPEQKMQFQDGHKRNYRFFKQNDNRQICGDNIICSDNIKGCYEKGSRSDNNIICGNNIKGCYGKESRYVLVSDRFEYYGADSENQIKLIDFLGLSENDTMRGHRVYPSPSGKPIPEAVIDYIKHTFGARKCLARPTFSSPDFEV